MLRVAICAALLVRATTAAAQQQSLGHKVLGTLGVQAGVQAPPGLYVNDRAVFFAAERVVDGQGNALPAGLDLHAFANGLGLGGVVEVPGLHTYATFAMAFPLVKVDANTAQPLASIDRFGLGDLYVMPLQLGWRLPHADVVTSYAFYAPTSPETTSGFGSIGRGHWTHQLSLGGALFLDTERTFLVSALASYQHNLGKYGVDVRRGNTVQVQGGIGGRVLRIVDVGLAAYAGWQVSDDWGSALPAQLTGLRERVFGLGPEVGVLVPWIHAALRFRYAHDFGGRARPEGGVFVVELIWAAWRPDTPS